jgi:hypothetical protein
MGAYQVIIVAMIRSGNGGIVDTIAFTSTYANGRPNTEWSVPEREPVP